MASNVVVLHNNRRHVIKTTPSMLCREILVQACQKIGIQNVDNFGLKNGKNNVDLALPVRLANLPAGAKLEIYRITASEASKPITIALQCSEPPIRLTGTFPPTATLTEVLLHFEQESNGQLNVFDRRGEEAVLSVLGREFGITEGTAGGGSTTLAGMGVGGNVLIRLGFRKSGASSTAATTATTPRMSLSSSSTSTSTPRVPITPPPQGAVTPPPKESSSAPIQAPISQSPPSQPLQVETVAFTSLSEAQPSHPDLQPIQQVMSPPSEMDTESILPPQLLPPSPSIIPEPPTLPPGPNNRSRIVFSESRTAIPTAASIDHDESAYNMTTEQARGYQAHLTNTTKSLTERTLMTREMREAHDREKAAKRAFTTCDIRIRFPDGMQLQGTFSANETIGDIYAFVRDHLAVTAPFQLHLMPRGDLTDIGLTIRQAGFSARTMLIFTWNQPVPGRILRDDVMQDAVDIEGHARALLDGTSGPTSSSSRDKGKGKEVPSVASNSSVSAVADMTKKLPKWLSKLSKK